MQSSDEPEARRKGCSLFIASMNILAIFKTTIDPFYQAASIYDEIANKGHYFVEGNKRTAHCMAKAHLFNNGYHFKVDYKYAVPYIRELAQGKRTVGETAMWLRKYSVRYQSRTSEKYLNKLTKEILVAEKRGRPAKNVRKRFQ